LFFVLLETASCRTTRKSIPEPKSSKVNNSVQHHHVLFSFHVIQSTYFYNTQNVDSWFLALTKNSLLSPGVKCKPIFWNDSSQGFWKRPDTKLEFLINIYCLSNIIWSIPIVKTPQKYKPDILAVFLCSFCNWGGLDMKNLNNRICLAAIACW